MRDLRSFFGLPIFILPTVLAGCDGADDGAGAVDGSAGHGASSTGGGGGSAQGAGGTAFGGNDSAGGDAGGAEPEGAPFTSEGSSLYETQTSLAADDNGNVVAAWIAFLPENKSAIGYSVSRNKGSTWTTPSLVSSPDGRQASSPIVASDDAGDFWLAWLGFRFGDPSHPDEHVYLSKLDLDAGTFEAPSIASDDGSSDTLDFDKPTMTLDSGGEVLLAWADFTSAPKLTFARSVDGTSFSHATLAEGTSFGNLAYLCLDKTLGTTAPIYAIHLTQGATLTMHRSIDAGLHWAPLSVPATDVMFQDPTCVVRGSEVWIAYASGLGFDQTLDLPANSIQIIHASAQGESMDAPTEVAVADNTGSFLYPRLAGGPSGELNIVYYRGLQGNPVDLVVTGSDDGNTWTTKETIGAGTMALDRTLATWLGAYVGVVRRDDHLLVSYTDNSANKGHIKFQDVHD